MTSPQDPNASVVRVELAPDLRAAGQARRTVREALTRWRRPQLVDAVVLAASELVTNAVRHGRPPVTVALQCEPDQVRLDVHDGSATDPACGQGEVDPEAESGRGLAIVQALADEVAVEQVPEDGKVVHVTFSVDPQADDGT